MNDQPIAVFDSGLGGLTVVRALQQVLPAERIIYFGDTARVPYGTKTSQTVLQFAEQDCDFLLRFKPKLMIVACNTATALALDDLVKRVPVPLLGVVKPGAAEAVAQADNRGIAVLATEATVSSEAYPKAISALSPRLPVTQRACPSLVSMIEEGRGGDDPILRALLKEYLETLTPLDPSVVLLGCTHYPLVAPAIAELMPRAKVVDSAEATAQAALSWLEEHDALAGPGAGTSVGVGAGAGADLQCFVSDNPARFGVVGSRFLGRQMRPAIWVTPEQFFNEHSLLAVT